MKKVLITGCTGQAGSKMVDYLLRNTNNTIVGGVRRLSVKNHKNINHLKNEPRFKLIDLDITDQINTERVIKEESPDYFINFAANSFVGNSWDMPVNHFMTNTMSVMYQLEAIRKYCADCRYFNAGSSEEFGNVDYSPQDANHPQKPRSPYGASKCAARNIVKVWRESYGLYAVQPFMFNYESEKRGVEFVTRKITTEVARIHKEFWLLKAVGDLSFFPSPIQLGNLDAKRDWSYCDDTLDGVWKMLNQDIERKDIPFDLLENKRDQTEYYSKHIKDYVLASGETHSIREFVEEAFDCAGFKKENCKWTGEGLEEKYICDLEYDGSYVVLVKINPKFYRPAEVELLLGDSTPARKELGWEPKTSFKELVKKMVEQDIIEYEKE